MSSFPVIASTLSATHLSKFLREKYDFTGAVKCSLIKAGVNHTYLVESENEKYILRIYSFNWRTRQEIEEELKLLNHLQENKIPVSYPIRDRNGMMIQELTAPEGNRFAVLFSFASGEKLVKYAAETHEKIGEIMARIHLHTLNYHIERINYNEETLLINPFPIIKEFLSGDSEEMDFLKSLHKRLLAELRSADHSKLRKGAVHLDIWFDNLNINAKDEITLFDFDFCGNGWLCLDIAYYLMQLHAIELNEEQYTEKLFSFLKGYESVTSISDEEKKLLHTLGVSIYFFYLGVQCQRFENWSNVFLNETYLKRYIEVRVKKYADDTRFDTLISRNNEIKG